MKILGNASKSDGFSIMDVESQHDTTCRKFCFRTRVKIGGRNDRQGIASVPGSITGNILMRTILAALALTTTTLLTAQAWGQQPTDYRTAYKMAQEGERPLLVLVTATWCPPCQVMKQTTIPALMQKEAFKDCFYSTVDLDEEEELARQLIGDRGVPQLIMYEKQGDQWVRRYLRGIQTPETVEAFVAQAGSFRTANATTELVGK